MGVREPGKQAKRFPLESVLGTVPSAAAATTPADWNAR